MQIDQEPREYRAAAVKGEPVFQPGAGRRVAIWAAVLAFMIGLSVVVQYVMGPLEPVIKGFVASLF